MSGSYGRKNYRYTRTKSGKYRRVRKRKRSRGTTGRSRRK